jgi:DNA repair protein RadC
MKNFIPKFKVSYQKTGKFGEMFPINSPEEAAEYCKSCFKKSMLDWREEFILICLSKGHKIIAHYPISSGGITGTVADVRMILQLALLSNATGIILSHNHPSGTLKPSEGDKESTNKIMKACKYHDISLLDHIIVTSEGYYSFSEKGLL